jgi:hypothetical protein
VEFIHPQVPGLPPYAQNGVEFSHAKRARKAFDMGFNQPFRLEQFGVGSKLISTSVANPRQMRVSIGGLMECTPKVIKLNSSRLETDKSRMSDYALMTKTPLVGAPGLIDSTPSLVIV